jgi:hypothetical protein
VRLAESVGLGVVALGLAALAFVERTEGLFAAALALGAVGFAGLALLPVLLEHPGPRSAPASRPPGPDFGIRAWLRSGPIGREEIVLLLDRLDRSTLRPDLPASTPDELASVRSLAPARFRRYVAHRLDEIEAGR